MCLPLITRTWNVIAENVEELYGRGNVLSSLTISGTAEVFFSLRLIYRIIYHLDDQWLKENNSLQCCVFKCIILGYKFCILCSEVDKLYQWWQTRSLRPLRMLRRALRGGEHRFATWRAYWPAHGDYCRLWLRATQWKRAMRTFTKTGNLNSVFCYFYVYKRKKIWLNIILDVFFFTLCILVFYFPDCCKTKLHIDDLKSLCEIVEKTEIDSKKVYLTPITIKNFSLRWLRIRKNRFFVTNTFLKSLNEKKTPCNLNRFFLF